MKKYYFISGFPRSGSTLLAGILNQNPKFHASMSTTLQRIFCEIQYNKSVDIISLNNSQTKNLFLKTLEGFYQHIDKDVIFDTSRGWPRFDSILTNILPYTKIICCVRDIPSILNSFEYYYKFRTMAAPSFVSPDGANNPWNRFEDWWRDMIATPYENCEYAFWSPVLRPMYIFVDYDNLIENPKETIKDLYLKLNLDFYQHDFDNIVHSFEAIDERASNEHLHLVSKKVGKTNTEWVLPQGVVEKYSKKCFWRE